MIAPALAKLEQHVAALPQTACLLTSSETETIVRQLNGIVRVLYEASQRAEPARS